MHPHETNEKSVQTLFKNSFTPTALTIEDGWVIAHRDKLPKKLQATFTFKEIASGFNSDGELLFCVTLDLAPSDYEADSIMRTLFDANNVGFDHGALLLMGDRFVFRIGISGASVTEVPGIILADSIGFALNSADAAQDAIRKQLKKKGAKTAAEAKAATVKASSKTKAASKPTQAAKVKPKKNGRKKA